MPNPPTMMLSTERFIAAAISRVRIVPEAPTSAPAMISVVFSSTKPAIATAVPVNAFSSEITTGMSAPAHPGCAAAPADLVSAPLGAHPWVADLILRRYDEARTTQPPVPAQSGTRTPGHSPAPRHSDPACRAASVIVAVKVVAIGRANSAGMVCGMATTTTVSYTLDVDLPEQVKAAARRAGLSTSAYVSRVLRRAVLRDAARRYAEWLEADAAVRDEIAAFRSLGDPAVSLAEMDAAS